jgi:hypothetical protein
MWNSFPFPWNADHDTSLMQAIIWRNFFNYRIATNEMGSSGKRSSKGLERIESLHISNYYLVIPLERLNKTTEKSLKIAYNLVQIRTKCLSCTRWYFRFWRRRVWRWLSPGIFSPYKWPRCCFTCSHVSHFARLNYLVNYQGKLLNAIWTKTRHRPIT